MIYVVFALIALLALQSYFQRAATNSIAEEYAKERKAWDNDRKALTAALLARNPGEAVRLVADKPARPAKAHEDPIIPEGL